MQCGEKTLSNISVYKWSSVFKKRRETENEPHGRWPRTSITGENSDRVDALIRENWEITVHELSGILNISDGSEKTIIKQHLQYSKVCARWIPRLLTDEHEYTAASGAIIVVAVRAGRGLFLGGGGFYRDNGRDVGALLHA